MGSARMASDCAVVSDEMRRAGEVMPRYSRKFNRGALGGLADGRSATGKWIRRLEAELLGHLGHAPSITEKLLVERVVRVRLQLETFDQRIASGEALSPHDGRTYGAMLNCLRLTCRELGLRPQAPRAETLEELFAKGGEAAA